jgi:hypothetical protein
MNSSIAASIMAARRSAARSVRLGRRLDAGAFGKGGFDAWTEPAFFPRRRSAGLDAISAGFVRDPGILKM